MYLQRIYGLLACVAAGLAIAACGSSGQDNAGSTGAGGTLTGASASRSSSHSSVASTASSGAGGEGGKMGSGPPYPFVLAHGFFGFEKFAGQDFLTYYYGVKDYLATHGEIVFTPAVDPFNDSTTRGGQLENRIIDVLQITGAAKVNIIGHSQGGLDARVVAHDRPDLVASVVTIATPHHGTPIADVVLKLLGDPNAQQIIDDLTKAIGSPIYDQIGNTTSLFKPFYLFSQKGIAEFNMKYPDAPGVFYASIAGRSSLKQQDGDCTPNVVKPFIKPWQNDVDPIEPLFVATAAYLDGNSYIANDGLVRAKDAMWGDYWGCVPADHLDEIGQLFGDNPGAGNSFDYKKLYLDLIAYMRGQGY